MAVETQEADTAHRLSRVSVLFPRGKEAQGRLLGGLMGEVTGTSQHRWGWGAVLGQS